MDFFDSFFLWKEAVAATVVLAMGLSVVGSYAVLRRVVFLPAALSQLSGAGVMTAFWLTQYLPWMNSGESIPLLMALFFTLAGAIILGRLRPGKVVSRESVIGITYIVASAVTIILAGLCPQQSHHVEDILFGNAILVDTFHLYLGITTVLVTLVIHAKYGSRFMFASFDEETARAHGLPVTTLNILLFITMALMMTVSTRVIGALPSFAFAVLPPWFAVQRFSTSRAIFISAAIVSAITSFAGYWISFTLDTPTGATATTFTAIVIFTILRWKPNSKQ